MLTKIICLLAVTSFVPFVSYADEAATQDEQAMIPQMKIEEQQLLAGCGCGKKKKDKESDDEVLIDEEEEETQVLAHHDGEHEEEEKRLAGCPGKCVPPTSEEVVEEEETKLASCPKCVPPNKNEGDDEDEQIEEEVKKIA